MQHNYHCRLETNKKFCSSSFQQITIIKILFEHNLKEIHLARNNPKIETFNANKRRILVEKMYRDKKLNSILRRHYGFIMTTLGENIFRLGRSRKGK